MKPIASAELPALVAAAESHGVLAIVGRHLRTIGAAGLYSILSTDHSAQLIKQFESDLNERRVILTGQSLLLAHYGNLIASAMSRKAIASTIVKGPTFARRLFKNSGDRTFTDIDILVDPSSVSSCAAVLEDVGLVRVEAKEKGGVANAEYKWIVPANEHVLIEVQTNLIHSPSLGAALSLSHSDLVFAGAGDPEDATALLLVAAVHAAAGHQFDRLQPLVDILQTVRGLAGPIHTRRLDHAMHRTGTAAVVQTALDLVARLFGESQAAALAQLTAPMPWRTLRRGLVTSSVVLRAQSHRRGLDSWRRKALRESLRRSGRAVMTQREM